MVVVGQVLSWVDLLMRLAVGKKGYSILSEIGAGWLGTVSENISKARASLIEVHDFFEQPGRLCLAAQSTAPSSIAGIAVQVKLSL